MAGGNHHICLVKRKKKKKSSVLVRSKSCTPHSNPIWSCFLSLFVNVVRKGPQRCWDELDIKYAEYNRDYIAEYIREYGRVRAIEY